MDAIQLIPSLPLTLKFLKALQKWYSRSLSFLLRRTIFSMHQSDEQITGCSGVFEGGPWIHMCPNIEWTQNK